MRRAVLPLLFLLLTACAQKNPAEPIEAVSEPLKFDGVQTLAGDTTALYAFVPEGKPAIVLFWSSETDGYEKSLSSLNAFHASNPTPSVVAVNLGDSLPDVRSSVEEFDFSFPILTDIQGILAGIYRIEEPETFIFVSSIGRMVHRQKGHMSEENIADIMSRIP